MEAPKRAYELTIRIGGDTWQDVLEDLQRIPYHVKDHGPVCDSTMGGATSDHSIRIVRDSQMTHERYFELVDVWLAQERARVEVETAPV